MTHIIHTANNKEYLIVQVMKGGSDFYLCRGNGYIDLCYWVEEYNDETLEHIEEYGKWQTPQNNYTYLFVAEEATEEQAEMVVEPWDGIMCAFYKNYSEKGGECNSALGSLQSLIRSNFPDHQQFNHVILLKEK